MKSRGALAAALLLTACLGTVAAAPVGDDGQPGFPRLMGMNIGAKNYDDPEYQRDLARLDVVILGFYRGWLPPGYAPSSGEAIRKAVRAIKSLNPSILVGQYTILSESHDDPKDTATLDLRNKLYADKWWLLDAAGRKVQWTAKYSAWEVNFTGWTKPDARGRRWPEWLAERNHEVYFRSVPEFDIVYLDNIMVRPRVVADWDSNGVNDDPGDPKILSAHYAGHLAYWRRIRALDPRALLVGNTDGDLENSEWRGQLDGAFLEALMGESWSIERRGWNRMMERYRTALRNTRQPKIVGFNVTGRAGDFRFFRYAFASCLLDDGYFSYTDRALGHSSVPWFDEYDYKLGGAISAPPTAAWSHDVWRRDFENGVVLVNPTGSPKTVVLEPGFRRLKGTQDPAVNSGAAVAEVRLGAKDGLVLRRPAPSGARRSAGATHRAAEGRGVP